MEITDIMQLLLNSPIAILLLWLLIREQGQHEATRLARDAQMVSFMTTYRELADRVISAVERLDQPGPLA